MLIPLKTFITTPIVINIAIALYARIDVKVRFDNVYLFIGDEFGTDRVQPLTTTKPDGISEDSLGVSG
ncbi:hypothetical protein BATDEDRAFT_87879 [Batrachochytrium dendrobatidis JAM81]|uniref:Uncharacterized protein n=1 Tax=Batrachochytrium dendrobatidis (strain JAM81 / FGSC 10211) TaxID=684364 RepID=F4P0E4_BATDJ|nr:uncharacterized protein BATDEDRAFT_87879 [Batrachochytrium dendrobatidis JAM81]EGF81271.1 hypothetical protein BATDEDRAFT_87879 [Batrachochytrium dendrobatidis JAM81]KAJ8325865.1 hypothetical protein O5D80_005508 [Batrachochytrium dendrobatidis]KAK5669645.1 hypothetical protein QVD99_004034 [Batrachochytrium dendrobatidis]|eukprot:XP_006678145.1 hypothetical protein BATDEDRAFT_87879 [Batrachochytrium dendrobatidis JAM81]